QCLHAPVDRPLHRWSAGPAASNLVGQMTQIAFDGRGLESLLNDSIGIIGIGGGRYCKGNGTEDQTDEDQTDKESFYPSHIGCIRNEIEEKSKKGKSTIAKCAGIICGEHCDTCS